MTRKEEEMMWNEARSRYADWKQQKSFIEGAMWADAYPMTYDGKAMLYVNNRSHENGYKEAVNKACDLLRDLGEFTEDFINDFRKAMKGE